MTPPFDKPLFIFEMANNHMGDVAHGLAIIDSLHEVVRRVCPDRAFSFAVKLQYRDLETFIHPEYRDRLDVKYVKRFTETALTEDDFLRLRGRMREHGFLGVCTPFDERSVDRVEQHEYDVVKVASCSLTDWPLLERIARCDRPLIVSTAGALPDEINQVVSFLQHRQRRFAVMHCVGEYPTRDENLDLAQIAILRRVYDGVPVGYSTHERPDNYDAIKIAVAMGATVLEKHVGLPTDRYALNAYSASPPQIESWLSAARAAYQMCGTPPGDATVAERRRPSDKEISDLRGLKRGVFARQAIAEGDRIDADNTFLAIPCAGDQLVANDLSKYIHYTARRPFSAGEPIMGHAVAAENVRRLVLDAVNRLRQLLIDSRTSLPNQVDLELSHHYGLARFNEVGAVIINIINREYCKKLLVVLPGQRHPVHRHERKEETFHVLFGDVTLSLDDQTKRCVAGDVITVHRGTKHEFSSEGGAVIEEISTTHYRDDSFYEDPDVGANPDRKTQMTFWADWLTKPVS